MLTLLRPCWCFRRSSKVEEPQERVSCQPFILQSRLQGAAPSGRANRREGLGISPQVASSLFCDLLQVLSEPLFSRAHSEDGTYFLGFL